jgi:hypothetical protein
VPGDERCKEIATMLNCREVTRKIASEEFAEAGWRQRLGVRLHLLMCRHCRRYAAQLRAVGALARNLWGPGSEDPDVLKRLEEAILKGTPRGSAKSHSADSFFKEFTASDADDTDRE